MNLYSLLVRHRVFRELLIFLAFLALTAIVTWPWVISLRDGVSDHGDPYSIAYFLWWDYHQTFRDPLNLFHATIFYPYRYSLAFGEYDYGVSLLFFPMFALGFRPLTIYSVAAFVSFPFTAYGTFRLARTLSGSYRVGWIAGIVLALIPFRFHHLAHLHLIFAGWIPLVLEALVLYARARTWRRAIWMGFAFLMNGLTCTTWLILTVIPLIASGILLIFRNCLWQDLRFWARATVCIGIAALLLLPFLIPYKRVAELNDFVRSPKDVLEYSATPMHWLAAEKRNKLWRGFGAVAARTEMVLFPGLIAPLLALAALILPGGRRVAEVVKSNRRRRMLIILDAAAIAFGVLAILAVGYGGFKVKPFGWTLLSVSEPSRCLMLVIILVLVRLLISYPAFLRGAPSSEQNLRESIVSTERSELMMHGLLWLVIGFAGSFGLNFFFHRALYDFVPGFQGMRVAVRWAMIAYVGLALLAGAGALRLSASLKNSRRTWLSPAVFGLIALAIVVELNVAPLELVRGEVDPDQITLYLKSQQPKGGIVELPAGNRNHLYMLRAADHEHPLVNANDSFISPLAHEVERLTRLEPNATRFFEVLERTPVSYVTVRNSLFPPEDRLELEKLLAEGLAERRLTFIGSFPSATSKQPGNPDDLYAVARVEPNAKPLADTHQPEFLRQTRKSVVLPAKLDRDAFVFYRLYKVSYGRRPSYSEFASAKKLLAALRAESDDGEITSQQANIWMAQLSVKEKFQPLSDEIYVSTLLANTGPVEGIPDKTEMIRSLAEQQLSRTEVLRQIGNSKAFVAHEVNPAFILIHYFTYLHREPDEGGFSFWLKRLETVVDYEGVNEAFVTSTEAQ
ncbi:MAG TPA: hypothetical protein VJ023_16380 [Pyrinomonadaceae bacterium]|nr:hypothetical protein [Pyrinomonadaceae bacterium]